MEERDFVKFYNQYADTIFRYCYFKTSSREKAKDLVQETFTRVWKYLTDGGNIGNVRAFLYRTAGNLIIDWYRKPKTVSLDEKMEDGFNPGEDLSAQLVSRLDGKLAMEKFLELDEPYREVLSLRFIDDLSLKEISAILGISENLVSVRIHRAIKKLREILEHYE